MEYVRTLFNQTYTTGWHVLLVECDDSGTLLNLSLQFNHDPSVEELQQAVINYGEATQYDKFRVIEFNLMDHKVLLKWFIQYIKDHPTITLSQYNTLLATKAWWEAATIRYFVYMIAIGLAQHYGVNLTSYTETFILGKVRDWIVATPIRKIARIVFGNHNEI
jgi:hypothetical protein